MNKTALNLKLFEYCRVCAKKSKDLRSLHEEIECGKTISELVEMMTQFTLHEDDVRPNHICEDCVAMLNTAYEFYNLVRCSEQKFEDLVSSNFSTSDIKSENSFKTSLEELHNSNFLIDGPCKMDTETENIFIEEPNVILLCDENEKPHSIKCVSPVEIVRPKRERETRSRKTIKRTKVVRTRRSNINNMMGEFECYKCRLGFPSLFKVKTHLQEHDAMTKCRICMKTLNHCEYAQHLCKGQEIDCQYCSKSFNTTIGLIKHINKNHKKHKNYKCYNCARAFHTKLLLEIHKPSHDAEELRFVCDICGNRFRTRYQIKEHIEINHTDKRCNLF